MSDDDDDNVTRLDFDKPDSKAEKRRQRRKAEGKAEPKRPEPLKERIPALPALGVDPDKIRKPDQRAVACVNMRLAGAPFHEIAKQLEYASPMAAKNAYISALANMFPTEDWETLRQVEAMRAEQLLRRSFAMASADYLVDGDTGERIPNRDRFRWHEQAGKDLALHAMITGAKAPTRMEVSADTQELNHLVNVLLQQAGGSEEIEADVFEIEELPEPANHEED